MIAGRTFIAVIETADGEELDQELAFRLLQNALDDAADPSTGAGLRLRSLGEYERRLRSLAGDLAREALADAVERVGKP